MLLNEDYDKTKAFKHMTNKWGQSTIVHPGFNTFGPKRHLRIRSLFIDEYYLVDYDASVVTQFQTVSVKMSASEKPLIHLMPKYALVPLHPLTT